MSGSREPGGMAKKAITEGMNVQREAGERVADTMRDAADAQRRTMVEFTRMFSEMKLPGTGDVEALAAAHRRNVETLTAANRVAIEGAQALMRRNMEIVQQSVAELGEQMTAISTTEPPYERAARQAEALKRAYERAVQNMRELSDLIQRSNGEALGLLNRRFGEAMDEMRSLMEKVGKDTRHGTAGAPGGPTG